MGSRESGMGRARRLVLLQKAHEVWTRRGFGSRLSLQRGSMMAHG